MIASLRGILLAKASDYALVEVAGLGYQVNMSSRTLARLPELGAEVSLFTRLQIKDDSCVLFGFVSQDEKDLFERLIGVSGIGPKAALSILSSYEVAEFISAVIAQEVSLIQRVPGIGKKTASRIVLELKDSFAKDTSSDAAPVSVNGSVRASATEALLSMGFSPAEAELALRGASDQVSESELLQYALKRLGQ